MREETKMKQSIIVIALFLLFGAYYLPPPSIFKNKESVEDSSYAIDNQMPPVKTSGANSKFEKPDSIFRKTIP